MSTHPASQAWAWSHTRYDSGLFTGAEAHSVTGCMRKKKRVILSAAKDPITLLEELWDPSLRSG